MITHSESKLIRSLSHRKYREHEKLYVVEGEKMVGELVKGDRVTSSGIQKLFATADWIEEHDETLRHSQIEVKEATDSELRKVSNLVTPQRVLALVRIPPGEVSVRELATFSVLGFESIRDPGNLGTIIRTADWFGIRHIICTPDSVDLYNPKVVQSTMGSMARVQTSYLDIEGLLKDPAMKDKPVYGTFLTGEDIYQSALEKEPLVLFGNESKGLSPKYDPFLRLRISIPPFPRGQSVPESLNLASSVAIICSEIRRRI